MLNTIALISPFGTRQVALESALPVTQGSPRHGLYPNENTTAEESRNAVPKGVGYEIVPSPPTADLTGLIRPGTLHICGNYQFRDLLVGSQKFVHQNT
jgi:hypothetical protein